MYYVCIYYIYHILYVINITYFIINILNSKCCLYVNISIHILKHHYVYLGGKVQHALNSPGLTGTSCWSQRRLSCLSVRGEFNYGDLSLWFISSWHLRCLAWFTSILSLANAALQIYCFIWNPLLIGLLRAVNPTLVPLPFYTTDKMQYPVLLHLFFIFLLLQWLNISH